jgi:predicted nuclease with TOPRIM domain
MEQFKEDLRELRTDVKELIRLQAQHNEMLRAQEERNKELKSRQEELSERLDPVESHVSLSRKVFKACGTVLVGTVTYLLGHALLK